MESRGDIQRAAHLYLWEIRRWLEKCPYRGTKWSARLREGRGGRTWITLWRERGREQMRGWCIYVNHNQRVALFSQRDSVSVSEQRELVLSDSLRERRGGRRENKNSLLWTLTRAEPKEERLIRVLKLDHCVPLGGLVMGFQTCEQERVVKIADQIVSKLKVIYQRPIVGLTRSNIVLCGHVWCDWQSLINLTCCVGYFKYLSNLNKVPRFSPSPLNGWDQ